jgi:tyrosyl-tRNA synthetase
MAPSKGEAKRLIQQGGISVNDEIISTLDKTFTKSELAEGLKIRKGKKHFHKAILG